LQTRQWLEQILGMLARIDFQPGDLAARESGQQLARQRGCAATQLDDVAVLIQMDQRVQQVQFISDQGVGHQIL
jgi:hypothetical protein